MITKEFRGLTKNRALRMALTFWYKNYKEDAAADFLAFKSFSYSDEDVSAGALEVMKLIGTILPIEGIYVDRNFFFTSWLSEKRWRPGPSR